MEIVGNIKNYEWGKLGVESIVAQLAKLNSDIEVSQSTPYAELWMGDHTSGPSSLKSNGEMLSSIIKSPLPFLFKVLSIRKALSIQVHPNKTEAERLHRERPDIYKDPNHKPELAIALTKFQALCGFRPYTEIAQFLEDLPPLKELLNGNLEDKSENGLRILYEKLMSSQTDDIRRCIDSIMSEHKDVLASKNLLEIFCTINADFPNDVGVLSLFFLNLIRLNVGESIFLAANEIHAYLSGDCIECMACSDNVIRAGLTPKYKDVNQLISCLNYKGSPPADKLFNPQRLNAQTRIFVPPVNDFAVVEVIVPTTLTCYELDVHKADSILLVLQGERCLCLNGSKKSTMKRGSIIYIPAGDVATFNVIEGSDIKEDFVGYVAMRNHFSK